MMCCLVFVFHSSSYSQFKISIQPGVQVPIGDFANTAEIGLGGGATVEYIQTQKKGVDWSITGTAGYNYFSANKDLPEGEDYSYSDIPVLAGLRYYLGKSDFRAYIGAELGFHLMTVKHNDTEVGKSYFGFAPVVGFKFYFARNMDLDINVKLNSISSEGSSISFTGFNFGVQFPL